MNNVGTNAVEAIIMPDHSYESFDVRPEAFMKMYNLRLLKIQGVRIPQGLSNLPDKLRIVHWRRCPLKYLPSSFQPGKLVELIMHHSRIERLWNGVKDLENLMDIDLSWSRDLIEIADLTGAPILERLILDGCEKLFELHPSVGLHRRLKYLSLRSCTNLRSFPSRIELESLETLDLYACRKLEKLPKLLGNMKRLSKLILRSTAISELPSSIENITNLKLLDLSICVNLVCLPSSICKLKYLEELLLCGCSKLENLPENLGNLESLEKLDLTYTGINETPPSIVRLKNLQRLSFVCCKGKIFSNKGESIYPKSSDFKLHFLSGLCSLTYLNLRDCGLSDGGIPSDIGSLSSLETLDLRGNNFVYLPFSLSQLSRLSTLSLTGCTSIRALPDLPSSIGTINANDCTSLERLPDISTLFEPTNVKLGYFNCSKMVDNKSSVGDALQQFKRQALFGNSETFSICLPGNGIPVWFSHQNIGSSINIQLPSNWYNKKLRGLAFCIVATQEDDFKFYKSMLDMRLVVQIDGGMIISKIPTAVNISSDGFRILMFPHVMLGYISRAWLGENDKRQLDTTFRFSVGKFKEEKCGIRLIYDDDNEKENDQFETSHNGESSCEPEKGLHPGINGTDTLFSDEPTDENNPSKRLRV